MNLLINKKPVRSWKRIKESLQKAASFVPNQTQDNDQTTAIRDFEEYLQNNEFKLAFDTLKFIAETKEFPLGFWEKMFFAAKEMQLEESANSIEKILENWLAPS